MRAERAVVGAHVDRGAQRAELIDSHGLGRGAKAQAHVDGHTLLGKLAGKAQHGRNTDAARNEQRLPSALGHKPAAAARAQQIRGGTGGHLRQTTGVVAHDGVPQLDGAGLGVGAIEAQGHAKQRGRIAGHGNVHKLAGLERTCKLGGRDNEREDAVGDLLVRDDLEVVHACSGRCGHRRSNPPCGCMVQANRKRGTARAPRTKAIRLC